MPINTMVFKAKLFGEKFTVWYFVLEVINNSIQSKVRELGATGIVRRNVKKEKLELG